jgi:hypothetical protein
MSGIFNKLHFEHFHQTPAIRSQVPLLRTTPHYRNPATNYITLLEAEMLKVDNFSV